MSEEPTDSETEDHAPDDDARYEVKWRKKSASPVSAVDTDFSAPTGDAPTALAQQLEEAQEQIRSLHDRWQRSAADLSNLRRRHEQDREDIEKFASMMLVAELLPVLDNFERALNSVPGNLRMLTWIQGVMLIERHMRALLEQRGVQPLEAQGQLFNPSFHEAIGERETDEVPAGHVVHVYQTGYSMHGRVIRPALVELARAPDLPSEPAPLDDARDTAHVTEIENVGP